MLEPICQAAAIPFHDDRVCLITSSSGKRWVFPKGMIDPGHSAREAALIEAWEEAGLVGVLDPHSIGSYSYEKYGLEHLVVVFRMTVREVHEAWPEKMVRERIWVTLDEAMERVEEPELKDILRRMSTEVEPVSYV